MHRPTLNGKVRSDSIGAGQFGTPRGSRKHAGVDYEVIPGDPVFAPMMGTVIREGWPYVDKSFHLCEIGRAHV